ncbi:MAG: hypothetical protein U1E65_02375 [Myxococcota bacterium]
MRALVIGRGHIGVTGDQLEGLMMYRAELASKLNFHFDRVELFNLQDTEDAIAQSRHDVVFFMTDFVEDRQKLKEMMERLTSRRPRPKLVYLDYFAQTSSPYFDLLLPFVDVYSKQKLLRDRADYQKDYLGGFIFTDWYSRHHGFDLGAWNFGSKPDPRLDHKLVLGWSLGVKSQYRWILRGNRLLPKSFTRRKYDLNGRLGLQKRDLREWYEKYREESQAEVEKLRSSMAVTPKERVKKRQYMMELRDSKLVFSPFGWGELCYRDYEAVAWGALLVKPSMSHLVTSPDIFVEDETYLSTAWDFSDFPEKSRAALADGKRSQRIIRAAQQKLGDYYERGGFVADVKRVLAAL